jgi:hypothetical protein
MTYISAVEVCIPVEAFHFACYLVKLFLN